jgi:tyrosyl-tRNA synthetase
MDVDVEVGGTDQTFNMLAGRTLLKAMRGKEKFVITNKLLVDATSGKKLSKTEGSLVNLDDAPREMFGKVMAMPDGMILPVAELSTDMTPDAMKALAKEKNPRDAKLMLAHEVVKTYHDAEAANAEQENWVRTFSKKEEPTDAPALLVKATIPLLDLLVAAGVESKSEARRLILAKSIKLDDMTHTDPTEKLLLKGGEMLKIGKHRFFRIEVK